MSVVQTLGYAFSNLKEQIKIVFSRATDGNVIVFANKIPCEMEIRLITSELPRGYGVKNMSPKLIIDYNEETFENAY